MNKSVEEIESKLDDFLKKQRESYNKFNETLSKYNHSTFTNDKNINVHIILHSHCDIGWYFL